MPPRRSPERLLAIVDAATTVFAEIGYAAAQMVDVARAADVSVGTLYNYVEGKGALLLLSAERPFADITEGRPLPVPTPDRAALLARLETTLDEHVRVPALEHTLRGTVEPEAVAGQLRGIIGELFDLIATTRIAADAMERSARDAPDLGELFYRRVRVRLLEQLTEYCEQINAARSLPAPLTPELAARFMLETVTWWARHRHRDPSPPIIDDDGARDVAITLITQSLATRAGAP